jgi:serine/threonine-protein kinase HipA
MMNKLPERIRHIEVSAFSEATGSLSQPSQFTFQYTGSQPVSLTMDVRDEPYNYGSLHPAFTQNLPEGYVRQYIYEKLQRHAHVNDLYLLALQGDKGIGHLSYSSELTHIDEDQFSLTDILSWNKQESLFPQLLDRYYLNGLLAGVQPKVMVPLSGRTAIHQNDVIVKTFDEEYDLLTVNEYVCMSAAKATGLAPPNFWLSDDHKCFVIERFDIVDGQQMAVEDFTVLMGKSNNEKYTSKYETLLKAVNMFTRSHAEVEKAYRYIVFNCLIGNGDAHLKNFSIMYDMNRENIVMSPPYDITHTLIYPTIDNKLALKMDDSKAFPDYKTLRKFGESFDIQKCSDIIDYTATSIRDYINSSAEIHLMPGLKESIEKSLSQAKVGTFSRTGYRHDKHRKFE